MSGLYLGVDLGASAVKAILMDDEGRILARAIVSTGLDFACAGEATVSQVLAEAGYGLGDVRGAVATGYGRKNLAIPCVTLTEISCHARGAYHYYPEANTVVDIGGQDNKIIRLGTEGQRFDFHMNRKCAAGTGAFLEEIASRLDLPLEELEALAQESKTAVRLGSFCTVFTFTEILALMRQGIGVPDIVKAAFRAVVQRVVEMIDLTGKVVATGGVVAHHPTIAILLGEATGAEVLIPPDPQLVGALGAALYAREKASPGA